MFVRATLKDGTQIISEFDKMSKLRRYANDVMAGRKQLAVWVPLRDTHPVTGEPLKLRGRRFIRGDQVNEIAFVEPTTPDHDYKPENFTLSPHFPSSIPTWVAPDVNTPEGAVAGVRYPVRRDNDSQRRYVILAYSGEQPELQTRLWLDAEVSGVAQSFGGTIEGAFLDDDEETLGERDDELWQDDD